MRKQCEFAPVCFASFVVAFALLSFTASAAQTGAASAQSAARPATAPTVTAIEPPNWWTNYSSPLMVLLYGENLNAANISTDYPGVTITRTQTEPDGKHAFVWLNLDPTTKPGTVVLHLKNSSGDTTAKLLLSARPPQAGKYQGVTRDDVIYLIMPDRFADGDPSNDQPPHAAAGHLRSQAPKAYHGGDLKGVQQHLPYLKDLGVTTLWLTPLYQNDDATSDYHGYGAVDEYAGRRSLRHHAGRAEPGGRRASTRDEGTARHGAESCWTESSLGATRSPRPAGCTARQRITSTIPITTFPPISDPHAVPANYIRALDGWFVNTLPDLAQENPLVASYLLQNALWWTESSGIDGFRIDTFPYVPRSFWAYYHTGLFCHLPAFLHRRERSAIPTPR